MIEEVSDLYGFKTQRDLERVIQAVVRSENSPRGFGKDRGRRAADPTQWFTFRNDYSGTVPAFGVMRITGVVTLASDLGSSGGYNDLPILKCDQPSTTFYQQYAVNGPQTVATGEYGSCALSGLIQVAYDTGTPAQGEGWGPKPSQFTLSENYPAAGQIVAVTDSTNKYALCHFGPIERIFGRAQGAIAKDATTGIVEVYSGAPTSGASIITSMTITGVHNPWDDIADNDFVGVNWRNGIPTLDAREC